MYKGNNGIQNKKKQMKSHLVRKFGIERNQLINDILEDEETNISSNNASKILEAKVKRRIKISEKDKDQALPNNNINKKIESLHNKLNIYAIRKPKLNTGPDTLHQSVKIPNTKVNYESLYTDYISKIVHAFMKSLDDISEIDILNNKSQVVKNSNSIGLYDPHDLRKKAKISMSNKNISVGLKSSKILNESANMDWKEKKAKGATKLKKWESSAKLSSKINSNTRNSKNFSNSSNEYAKTDSNVKKSTKNKYNNAISNFNTAEKHKKVHNNTKSSNLGSNSIQPKGYMSKLEKFYNDLLNEIKEEAEQGNETDEHEYSIRNGNTNI